MKFFRTVFLASILATLSAVLADAATTSGLWLATVSVNKVGEVNNKTQDSIFDLGVSAVQANQPLIGQGSGNWSFYADGPLAPNWQNSAAFSGWPTGRAPLGYQPGSGGYVAPPGGTKVSFGSYSTNKNLTTYFRKTFTVVDKSALSSLGMRVWFDDAIQIFMNGVSIYSDNVVADWSYVIAGASGTYSAGIRNDGSLWTWGFNQWGQLGDGTNVDKPSPVRIMPGSTFRAVAAGVSSTVAIRSDGALFTWGGNGNGQLGGGSGGRNTPQQVGTDTNWQSVASCWDSNFAIKNNGTLWAWGLNYAGELGLGDTTDRSTPTQVGTDADWKTVTAGRYHVAAIKNDGSLWLWGKNDSGQIGDNSTITRNAPVKVGDAGSRWLAVALGQSHTLAIKEDGTLWSWGSKGDGRLGLGTLTGNQLTPKMVGTDSDWRSVAAGDKMSLAIRNDGSLWGWGTGTFGTGFTLPTDNVPVRIGSDNDWLQVSASAYPFDHPSGNNPAALEKALALRGAGKNALWGWGGNRRGGLGDGTTTDRPLGRFDEASYSAAYPDVSAGIKAGTIASGEADYGAHPDRQAWRVLTPTALTSFYKAVAESPDVPASYRELSIPAAYLNNGDNSVAIELYGAGPRNPELYFDMELTGIPLAPIDLISDKSDGWKYLDTATAALASWNSATFTDSGWSTGAAPLGYLLPPQASIRQTLLTHNPDTVYYRKGVNVTNPTRYSSLNLRLLRDDGAVVYLNGKELMRSNMPSGTIIFNTAPQQIIGSVDSGRYVTATVPLASGDLVAGNNVFSVEIHQHPTELAPATTQGALTPAGAEFPMRLLLHVDASGTVRLLKEAIIMKDSNNNTVILADSALAPNYSGISLRGSTMVGLRTSAIGYDFNGSTTTCTGALGTGGSIGCGFVLASGAPSNPFLHRFHPDHDNLDEQFNPIAQGQPAESYEIARTIKLTLGNRYPANPDEPERPASSIPPGWGATLLGGTYGETITGLDKDTLSVSGWFTMKLISATATLKQ